MVDNHILESFKFLTTKMAPHGYILAQKKQIVVKVTNYQLLVGCLYKLGVDSILRRCVLEHEIPTILAKELEGLVGGHYVGKETIQNILFVGLWWLTIH